MRILPTLLVTTVMASPVLAGSPEIYVPPTVTPVEPVQTDYFTGLSVYGGLTFSSNTYDILGDGNIGPAIGFDFDLPDLGGDGVGATLGVGYDFKVSPNVVLGAFLDYTWVNTSNDTSVTVSTPGPNLDFDYELQQKSAWTIGGRAGYTPSERTMIYGLLGWTRGSWEGDYDASGLINASDSYDFDMDGYTLGLGIETYVAQNMTLRLEYRNTKFDDYDLLSLSGGGSAVDMDMETRTQTVSAVVAYRF